VEQLATNGFRVELSVASEPLGKRIRNAKTQKVPYVLVVGDDDVAASTVGVNPRGGEVERDVKVDELVSRLLDEAARRA
jgi:threonyl-tRNA synthetase